ncbi:MAG: hypothetical protein ACOYMT_06615 [Chthoniobacterales bacterium]|jgi:hypothetical protein
MSAQALALTLLAPLILSAGLGSASLNAAPGEQPVSTSRQGAAPGLTPSPSNPALPVPTESRRLALETAGAFINDGFHVRDGEWSVRLAKGAPAFLQVTLFEGNRYWFVVASPTPGVRLRVTLHDAAGKPLGGEVWHDERATGGSRAAAGVAPGRSGKYFVGVELLDSPSGAPVDTCLVSAYK